MIKLLNLSLSSFKSFKDKSSVSFPASGLVLIQGVNHDTAGSSGAGKSSIIEAISFGLGFSSYSATDLKSSFSDTPPSVLLQLLTEKGPIEISKGASNYLKFLDSDKKVTGAKNIEEALTDLLGMNSTLIEALTYRPQRSFGRFISMTDADKKDFLSNCLRELEELEKQAELSKEKVKALEMAVASFKNQISSKTNEATRLRELPSDPYIDSVVFTQEIEKNAVALTALVQEKELLAFTQTEEKNKNTAVLIEHRKQLDALEKQKTELMSKIYGLGNIQQDRNNFLAQKTDLLKAICPTCKQQWQNAQATLENIELQLQLLDRKALVLAAFTQQKDSIQKQIQQLPQPTILPFSKEADLAVVVDKINQLNQRQVRLQADLSNNNNKLAIELGHKQAIDKTTEELSGLHLLLSKAETDLVLENTIAKALGRQGYLGGIFEEILIEIAAETNTLLQTIPNVEGITLQFKTEAETKTTNKIKKTIQPVLYKRGSEMSLKVLSGGQQASIELAVDLAVGRVIGRRTGRTPGWLILDEAFDGLDLQSKEACLAMLQIYAQDRLVLVIDHSSEVKEGFSSFINVELKDGISKVV